MNVDDVYPPKPPQRDNLIEEIGELSRKLMQQGYFREAEGIQDILIMYRMEQRTASQTLH